MTRIDGGAFWYCSNLTNIEIGNGVTSIGGSAFYYCKSLTNIEIPDRVTSIGYQAFYNCSSLTIVKCNAVTPPTLSSYAFSNCSLSLIIYVPAESVDAYKAATNWSTYSSNIQAIPTI